NRKLRRTHTGVDGGGRAAAVASDNPQRPDIGEPDQDSRRIVLAGIVDDDDLHGPAVGLRDDRFECVAHTCRAVVHWDDEADAFPHGAATRSTYTCSICAEITSLP